jgi:copper(I)-binding protein
VHRSGGGGGYPRRVLIAVAAALIPMIAGCEAGASAPVLHWHQPTDGTSHQAGNITISNAFVLGAPIGAVLGRGQNAGLFLSLSNLGSFDRLTGISTDAARSVLIPGRQIPLNTQHAVLLTGPRPALVLEHLLYPLKGGSVVQITLTFEFARSVKISVPVMPRAQFYTSLLPAPQPATPATPSAPATPKPTSPSASASPSPTAS